MAFFFASGRPSRLEDESRAPTTRHESRIRSCIDKLIIMWCFETRNGFVDRPTQSARVSARMTRIFWLRVLLCQILLINFVTRLVRTERTERTGKVMTDDLLRAACCSWIGQPNHYNNFKLLSVNKWKFSAPWLGARRLFDVYKNDFVCLAALQLRLYD